MLTRRLAHIAVVLALAAAHSAAQQVVAVTAIGWKRVQPPTPLKPWDKLAVGEKIQFAKQSPFVEGLLILADSNGNLYHRIPCKTEEECAGFYIVPAPKTGVTQPNAIQRVFLAVVGTLNSSTKYLNLITKPKMAAGLSDGVASLDNGSIDLSGVFKLATYGRYKVTIRRAAQVPADPSSPVEVEVAWKGQRPLMGSAPGITPGVYLVDIQSGEAEGLSAYVLICDAKSYQEKSSAFEAVEQQTSGWTKADSLGDYVSTGARRAFLCAYLDLLAASPREQ